MTKDEKRTRFLHLAAHLVAFAELQGIHLICFTFHRTADEQYSKYRQGTSNCDGYSKKSQHQEWLAMDFVIVDEHDEAVWVRNDDYDLLGGYWKMLGNDTEWGGDWLSLNDIYHFQLKR